MDRVGTSWDLTALIFSIPFHFFLIQDRKKEENYRKILFQKLSFQNSNVFVFLSFHFRRFCLKISVTFTCQVCFAVRIFVDMPQSIEEVLWFWPFA